MENFLRKKKLYLNIFVNRIFDWIDSHIQWMNEWEPHTHKKKMERKCIN